MENLQVEFTKNIMSEELKKRLEIKLEQIIKENREALTRNYVTDEGEVITIESTPPF